MNPEEQELIQEIYKHEKLGFEDPVYFAEWHLGICLHDGQKAWLRNADPVYNPKTTRKNLLLPSNRWGKTVVLAVRHIRFDYYKIGLEGNDDIVKDARYATLDLSPHSAQITSCYNYILDILQNKFPTFQRDEQGNILLDKPKVANKCRIGDFYAGHNSTKNQIYFNNNTMFAGLSTGEDMGASAQGKTYGLITYDECVLSHHLQDELFGRIFSRTFDLNAPIDLVSTFDVDGKSQQYLFHLLRGSIKGENEWSHHLGIMDENIFIPAHHREDAKKKLLAEDPLKYRQVVLGEAISSSRKCFPPQAIEQIWEMSFPRPGREMPLPLPGHLYLISVDWGFADQGDPTVMMVFDYSVFPYRIVYHEKLQGASPTTAFATLQIIKHHFFDATVIMDTNSLGGVVIKKLLRSMGVKSYDFDAHGGDKGEALIQTQLCLQQGRKVRTEGDKIIEENPDFGGLRSYYIKELEEQLADYEIEDEKLVQDFVVVLYQGLWWIKKKRNPQQTKVFNVSNTGGRITPVNR